MQAKFIGYCASSEQYAPKDLVANSVKAEEAGFKALMVSDHFQPWTPEQGQSSFIWAVLGALGQRTSLPLCSGVCAPGPRWHPAVLAQAAATTASLYPGRFSLGLGSGEALNEHFSRTYWPEPQERVQRLLEAVEIIRGLFSGKEFDYAGRFFSMERVRLYSLPETPPPVFIATAGPYLAQKSAQVADGMLTVMAKRTQMSGLMQRFDEGLAKLTKPVKPKFRWLQLHVSWAPDYCEARDNAMIHWPNGGMDFSKADIRYPAVFSQIAKMVQPEHFNNRVLITSNVEEIAENIRNIFAMGFTGVYLHNCGLNQSEFLDMCRTELLPGLQDLVKPENTVAEPVPNAEAAVAAPSEASLD